MQRPRSAATAPTQEHGGAAPAAPIRLFVGGVAAVVTPAELAERFKPFGRVTGVQLVAGKALGARTSSELLQRQSRAERGPSPRTGGGQDPACGTAYVDLLLRAEDLQRCISLVRGNPHADARPPSSRTAAAVQRLHVARLEAARRACRGALHRAPAPRKRGRKRRGSCSRCCGGCGAAGRRRRRDARGAGGGASDAIAAAA